MKTPALLALLLLAPFAAAQGRPSPLSPLPQRGEGSRVDAIMNHANDRISAQMDVWFDDGDFPATIQILRLQAEMYPSDYDVWTNLGWMQENVQQWDAALATYVRFKRQNPQDPDGPLPEANFYFMRRLYAKVPPLMEAAIKAQTKTKRVHPNAYRILARSYEKQEMLTDAARIYKALTERDPNDGAAKANLKRVEGKIGGKGR